MGGRPEEGEDNHRELKNLISSCMGKLPTSWPHSPLAPEFVGWNESKGGGGGEGKYRELNPFPSGWHYQEIN